MDKFKVIEGFIHPNNFTVLLIFIFLMSSIALVFVCFRLCIKNFICCQCCGRRRRRKNDLFSTRKEIEEYEEKKFLKYLNKEKYFKERILEEKFKKIVLQFKEKTSTPGIVVGITKEEVPLFKFCSGFSDVENLVQVNEETSFRIGSVSKSITSSLVMYLVERKKLDLLVPVQEYLKEIDFPKGRIKGGNENFEYNMGQILSHFSGVRNYLDFEREYYRADNFDNVNDFLEDLKKDELVAKPGETFHYSTYSYSIVQSVIEKVEGNDFFNVANKSVLLPLGMKNTILDEHEKIVSNRSKGYYKKDGILKNSRHVNCSMKFCGGGMRSNLHDLLNFGNGILYNKMFQKKTKSEMFKKRREKLDSQKTNYGYGWFIREKEGIYFHSGTAVGYSSLVMLIPKKSIVIVVLTNLQSSDQNKIMQLGDQIYEVLEREKV